MEVTIPEREARRSFRLNVFNGASFNFAERLIDPPLVLTWFVSQLTDSNLLVGLVAPLGNAGWFLPQIFVSARVQRMERKMPTYVVAAAIRTTAWILLAAAVWLIEDPVLLLAGFFLLYATARVSAGLAGLAFFDVTAKTVPAQRRGSLFAWRQFLGGLWGLGAGWIVKTVLNHLALPFPRGHAFLFVLYCAVMVPALGAFIAIREPPGAAVAKPTTVKEQLRRARQIVRENRVYRRHIAIRLTLALAGIALPFYGIYAKDVLGAPAGMVGVYVTTRVGAQLLFNLPWGRLSDQRGNRLAMRLQCFGNGLTALLALALVGLMGLLRPQGAWLPYLALPLFVLDGATRPAQVLTGSNFLLELVPDAERPLYLGLSNTLMGIVVLISGLGGLLVDLSGFATLFAVALGLCLAGYVLATGLPEPRQDPGAQVA
ncbi:MAG TPA: MFS transporter [Anaerolineae bacterium]|nr:MFS transporter [Anaerolineae bacterium]